MTKDTNFSSILELANKFNNSKVCLEYLVNQRWGQNIRCAHCNHDKVYSFKDGKRYKCVKCRKQFTPTTGTIFENTKIPLQKWFIAVYMATSHKKGISSMQLSRDIKVTQKTAWFMLHRIREMVKEKAPELLDGIVEVDETFVGGKAGNKHFNKKTHKLGKPTVDKFPVFGMLARNGQLRSIAVPDIKYFTLYKIILDNIGAGSTIMSDEYRAYKYLPKKIYKRGAVCHSNHNSKNQYVNGNIHINTLEGAWGLFKRSIFGIYHSVSKKHLNMYCQEFDFRYNTRHINESQRLQLALSLSEGRLKYADLIKKAA